MHFQIELQDETSREEVAAEMGKCTARESVTPVEPRDIGTVI